MSEHADDDNVAKLGGRIKVSSSRLTPTEIELQQKRFHDLQEAICHFISKQCKSENIKLDVSRIEENKSNMLQGPDAERLAAPQDNIEDNRKDIPSKKDDSEEEKKSD